MKKKIFIVLAVLVVLFVAAVAAVALAIDPIVRTATEEGATAVLKVPTTLQKATIRYSGSATLDKFEIANPPGYKEPRACAFEKFEAALRIRSLLEDTIDVEKIEIVKPDLTIEFIGTKSNWAVLMDNLASSMPKTGPAPAPEPKPAAESGPQKKFRIQLLRVESATVQFRSDLIPGGATSLTIAPIELHNIGTAEKAASPQEILSTLFQALGSSALKAGEGSLPKELLKSFNAELDGARQALQGTIDQTKQKLLEAPVETVKDAGKNLKDAGKGLEEGVKDIFKRKK